jgi:hypothetical protein
MESSIIKNNQPLDFLSSIGDDEIIKQFNDQKEIIIMSCKVEKWNKYMWQQERNFVITNKNIYNFNKKSKKHYNYFSVIEIKIYRAQKGDRNIKPSWNDKELTESFKRVCDPCEPRA